MQTVRIMTFVTNADGVGPGHTAVAVGNTVYTFEDMINGWFLQKSSWKILDFDTYVGANAHRPVLIQTVNNQANPDLVTEYVKKSIAKGDAYIGSGVCSTQVSKALNYSLPASIDFDPKGIDTPLGVYRCARRLALVAGEDYIWADRSSLRALTWSGIVNTLRDDYPDAYKGLQAKGQFNKY